MSDFIKTLTDIFANGGPGTYIATGSLILLILCVVIQAFSGFRKGYPRQTAKTAGTLLAALVAFIIVEVFCNSLFGIFDNQSVTEVIATIESQGYFEIPTEAKDVLLEMDPLVIEYLLAMVFSPLLAPIVFMVLFLVLNIFFRIVYHIVKWVFHIKKKKGKKNRLIGAAIGAVHGFIFAAIIILPITVFADVANVVIEAEIESTGDEELEELYEEEIVKTTSSPVFKTVKALGGNGVLNAFGKVKNDETKFNAREEFFLILEGSITHVTTLTDMDIDNLTEKEKAAIDGILDMVGDSDFLSTLLAEVLSAVSDMIADEADVEGEAAEPIINAIVDLFKTSTKKTVKSDLKSITDILFLLSDNGVMDAMDRGDEPGEVFTKKDANGKTVISRILDIIHSNPRFANLETALVEASISMLTDGAPISAEAYQNIKTDFNTIITMNKPDPQDEEAYNSYLDTVSASINESLVAEGITLEEDILDSMAEYVAENYGGSEKALSDSEFNDIMLSYYDSYLESIQTEEN